MTMLEIMRMGPVIPVIVIENEESAVPLARALVTGGVRVVEITLRTPAALASVAAVVREVPDAVVGVGTVTRLDQLIAAKNAGATFAVSPGLTPLLAQAAAESRLPLLPGTMTPSDVIAAIAAGYRQMKLFPAQQAGGIGMLKAMAGPFPDIVFCPTGGIKYESAPDFLALANVACVGGSWLTPHAAVAAGDWGAITDLARQASALRDRGRATLE